MEAQGELSRVNASQAVDGMRRPFMRAFGRTPVGRRLAAAAWAAFRAALLHGSGIAMAQSHARMAAGERNDRSTVVARWSASRVERTVDRAVHAACNSS